MRWQNAAIILGLILAGAGVITYTDLFGVLTQLTGVEATYSGDQICGSECESYINITTTYWRICFSHYNNSKYENETLFKKQSRSRTLHVNLDNIDNIISTNPEVRVDWLVPTYGKKWRPLKDGDCWDRGKINKIKLVGHKDPFQDVKWSFEMEGEANISIDPMWKGIKSFTETDKWKVNFYAEPHLTKTCFKISVENKQDGTDNFPFQSILNQTSIDINKVTVTLKEKKKEDYFVTICNICEVNRTINQSNNLTEFECNCSWLNSTCICEINQTLNITSCSECGSYQEERERWVWKDRNLVKEEKEGDKEIRNQFEEVTIQKAGNPYNPAWFELCYEFNEVPIREDGNWGSSGFMYLNSSTGVYFDFENSSWWNVSFDKKREINCSNMETDQPFVINGSSGFSIGGENQIVWTVCKGTGTALYYNNYTDYVVANDTEQLPFEVERGNGTSYNPTSVWDSNYEGVWHLPESSGDAIDSTNVLNATYKGDLPTPVDGKIGKAQSLDGTGDYAEKTTSELKNQNFTLEAWAKTSFTNPDLWAAFVSYHNLNDYYGYIFRIAPEGWGFHRETCICLVGNSGSILAGTDIVRGTSITDDTWHYVVATNDGTTLKVYVDGASPHTGTSGTSIWDTTMYLDIGATYGDGTGSSDYPGLLDEVRVSDSCRSDDWINASYKNAIGTAGYGMLGSEEAGGDATAPTYSDNSTNSTLAGASTLFSLKWEDETGLSGYIFSFCNGTWNGSACVGDTDYSSNTCSAIWGSDCGTTCDTPEPNNTYDDCANCDYEDERINEIYLNATKVKYGDEIAVICEYYTTETTNDEIYVYYRNSSSGTWVQKASGSSSGSGSTVRNWTQVNITADNIIGEHQVRCIIDFQGEDDECGGAAYFDNDDSNFTVVSEGWVNDSWVAMGGVLNWSNVTKSVNSTVGANISWIVYANDTSDNWNTSDTYSYTTTSAAGEAEAARWDLIETGTTIGGNSLIRIGGDI